MAKSRQELTADRLRELLIYDPETGFFNWRVRRGRAQVGDRAGSPDARGYLQIQVDGTNHHAHRLAVIYQTRAWPEFTVDHKNGVVDDNRYTNLRDIPHRANVENQRACQSRNASGLLGVSPAGTRWRATLGVSGSQKHLGCFETPEDAHEAYVKAKRELHAGCTI